MAAPSLSTVKISDVRPFCDVADVLDQAGSILMLLSLAYERDDEAAQFAGELGKSPPDWAGMNRQLFKNSLEGIASLLVVAKHLHEVGDEA